MTVQEFLLEALKVITPLGLAYVGVLKTRTDLDIIAAKQRTPDGESDYRPYMRQRWYHRLKKVQTPRKKESRDGTGPVTQTDHEASNRAGDCENHSPDSVGPKQEDRLKAG